MKLPIQKILYILEKRYRMNTRGHSIYIRWKEQMRRLLVYMLLK